MSNLRVLIAFATRYGTTDETAKDLAKLLDELGIKTDIVDLKQTKKKDWPKIDIYDGIIVASGIKIGRWMKEPQKFLKGIKAEIESKGKKLGLFVSCMTCLNEPEKANQKYLENMMTKLEIKANIYQSFGPVVDFSETSRIGRISQGILKGVAKKDLEPKGFNIEYTARNDLRDKEKLKKFAEDFANLLK